MSESGSSNPHAGPRCAAGAALDVLSAGLDGLIDVVDGGGLGGVESAALLGLMSDFERVRNRLSIIDHGLLAEADRRGLPAELGQGTLRRVLVHRLRLSPAEAHRRVLAAAAVGPRMTLLGELLGPVRTLLAAGQRCGDLSAEQVSIIERALDKVDRPGLDAAHVDQAEQILTVHARTFGPAELRRIAVHVVDAVNPDGTLPDEQLQHDRRDLQLTPLADGSFRLEGRLTAAVGVKLGAVLGPLSKPRSISVAGPNGRTVDLPDPRTPGQRIHDGLDDALSRLLRTGGLPSSGGTPATVIVTISMDSLLTRTGHGTSTDGTQLSAKDVLALAGEADILPAVLTTSGVLLEMGRSRRVANQNQTFALIARDAGCSFPGCAHPPEYSDRHHIRGWVDGGKTNLNNLTLLCRYHHTHFAGHGWSCQLNSDGLPEWTPPHWVDPTRKPMINDRIKAKHALTA